MRFICSLFEAPPMQRLPMAAQMTVSVAQGTLIQVAELADALVETLRLNGNPQMNFGVNQITDTAAVAQSGNRQSVIEKKVDELTKLIAAVQSAERGRDFRRGRSRSNKRDQSRRRNSSPPAEAGLCWYHYQFSKKATKCGKKFKSCETM